MEEPRASTKQRKFQHSGVTPSRERNLCRVKISNKTLLTRETKKKRRDKNRTKNNRNKTGVTKGNYFHSALWKNKPIYSNRILAAALWHHWEFWVNGGRVIRFLLMISWVLSSIVIFLTVRSHYSISYLLLCNKIPELGGLFMILWLATWVGLSQVFCWSYLESLMRPQSSDGLLGMIPPQ